MEVARALGYPQSSASELLQSLAALGYLRYDARRRTFSAGARAAMLGATLSSRVFGGGDVGALVDAVAAGTRREAYLCDVVADSVHFYVTSTVRAGLPAPVSLPHSAAGLLFLAGLPDAQATRLGARDADGVKAEMLSSQLAQVRSDGFALRTFAGGAELGVSLHRQPGPAVCVCGPRFAEGEEASAMARRLRAIVRRWRDPDVRRQPACNA